MTAGFSLFPAARCNGVSPKMVRASTLADNGRFMDEEPRLILRDVVGRKSSSAKPASTIHSHFGPAERGSLVLHTGRCAKPTSFH